MLCCGQNWTKKWYRNPFKKSSQINTKLGLILHPTWLHFGRFLEVKMEPNSFQDAFKMQSFFHSFFDIVFYRFLSQLGPNLAPTWPQLGPQIHPKTHPRPILERKSEKNPTKMGPKLITFNQHEPKDPQSRPRTPPCTSFSLIFDRFLMDFWYYFHRSLFVFFMVFDPMLTYAACSDL